MASPAPSSEVARVRRTVLVVGAGYAEQAFLKHLRRLYLEDRRLVSLTPANCRCTSSKAIVQAAIRLAQVIPHDSVSVLVEPDDTWTDAVAAVCRRKRITPIVFDRCLEELLLCVYGESNELVAAESRQRFQLLFGGEASDEAVLQQHFPVEVMSRGRARSPTLDALLVLLGL